MTWLNEKLKKEIRQIFESKYKRKLLDIEVEEIAENLTGVVEELLKLKWRQKYGNERI